MAGDVNSNIFINVDTSSAMAQLRALEKELTALNRALVVGTKTAAQAQSKYAQGLLHNVNATGQWTASMTRMSTASEQFANNLDRSRLSLKEYFRYGMASTKTFGRVFGSEFDTVSKLVQKRVKTLQQQYVQLGRDAQGAMNALKFTPKALNYRDVTTQLMMATQRQQIFNKLLDDGSTKLLNFGKNTQWAGRQLMVGFTVPLMLFGAQAIRVFKEIETQTIRFKKVYGDIFTDPGQTDLALKNIRALADEYTKYGVKVADTIKMAADAAAAGNSGKQLEQIVEQTNRLAVLGGVTQEKALETTIALKNAFQIGAEDLDQTINFLNAVENQTVVALEDLTEAIPRVAPVVQQLGGDVKDLAFFMAAMQEGGISAAQGANALKSGLGSLINPSNKAAEAAAKVGVNIRGIVEANQGNLRNIVVGFAQALEPLTDLQKTRVIEDVFGKYQFARISALLNNVTKEGTQAARVLQLANSSVEELGILAERELGVQANSSMNKFVGAVERLKAAIAPVGEVFAKTLTPVIEFITKMAERFNKLPDGVKKAIAVIGGIVGGLGPIFLMTFGLMANAMANAMKGFNLLRKGYQQLAYGSSDAALKTQYLTQEELENISVTNALYSTHDRLSAAYKIESTALGALIAQYGTATNAMRNFSMANPGLFVPGKVVPPIRRAGGGKVSGPGTATSDSIPAYLSDGEYVINAKAVDTYGVGTFDALNARKYAGGGPVIGEDGIPRLFGGGWMTRILNSMLPRTRMGVVQEGANGFALSGFGGGSRAAARVSAVAPSPNLTTSWRKIPWEEDVDGFIIRDPNTDEVYKIRKGNKEEFDSKFERLVAKGPVPKNKDRPEMSPGDYLLHRLYKYKKIKKGPLTPSNIFKNIGEEGKKRNKQAPGPVRNALERAAKKDPKSNAARVLTALDQDADFLRTTSQLTAEEKAIIKGNLSIDVSHIDPKDSLLWSPRTGSRDLGVINKAIAYERKKYKLNGSHIFTTSEAEGFLQHLRFKEATEGKLSPTHKAAMILLEKRIKDKFYDNYKIKDLDIGLSYPSYRTDRETGRTYRVDEYAMGGPVQKYAGGTVFVGMPKSFAKVQKTRALAQKLDKGVRASRFKNLPVTDTGVKIKSLGGYSVGEISKSVNGIYRHPNGRVVVYKAVESEEAALAEMRMSALMRHGSELNTPRNQSIKVIADPTDLARQRKILAIESDYDPRFENPKGEFNEKQFIKQTLASGIRGDKDVKRSNLSEDDVIDQGNSGVFSTASSRFKYADSMKSVEEQLLINFGAVKGSGASKDFAKAVRKMAQQMGYPAFKRAMLKEIEESLPRYRATIDTFKLTPKERKIYDDLVLRLEQSKDADWKKIYNAAAGIPGYQNGVFSVPGPKGAGDVVPAMLSPGEAVIPTAESEKYRPLIRSIIADKVPGFITGRTGGLDDPWDTPSRPALESRADRLADKMSAKIGNALTSSGIGGVLARKFGRRIEKESNTGKTPMTSMERNAAAALNNTVAANTAAVKDSTDTTQTSSKTAKQIANEQKKLKKTQGVGGYFRGFGKVPDVDPETGRPLNYQEKTNYRQNNRMQRTQAMMGPSMALSMAGSMGMMYGMGKPDSFAGQNMGLLMGITAIGSLLPLLNSPIKMLIASVVGLLAVYKMQSNAIKQSILDGQEQAKAMSMTTSKLEALGKYTQQVSITQVSAAQRAARTAEITPVNQTFGFNFLDSETGKQFKKDFDKTVDQFGTEVASRNLANQLSSAVQQGVFTAEEAESVATYLARSLNDTVLEAQLRGRIIELVGPNGENLSKDPYALNVSIMADARSLEQVMLQKLESTMKDIDAGLLGVSGSRQASGKPGGPIVGDPRKWNEGLQLAITTLIAGGISFGKIMPKLTEMLRVSMLGIGSIAGKARLGKTVFSNIMAGGAVATSRLPGGTLRGGGAAFKGAETASKASKVGRAITGVRAAGAAVKGASLVAAGTGAAAGGVGAIPGIVSFVISSAIFGGIEFGLRQWQRGEEKKAIAKVAGQIAGITTENLALSQQGIDAMNAEYNAAIENLNIRKKQATNAAERAKLEESILDLEQKRDTAISESRKQQAQIIKDAADYLDQIESQGAKDKYVEAYSEQFKKKFKDDPFMKARGESLMTTMKERGVDQKATIQVQALVTSDQLSLGQAEALVTTLTADGGNLEKQLDLVIKTTGIEGLTRYAEIAQYLSDNSKKQLKQVVNQGLLSGQKDAVEGLYSSLEELIKLPDFVGINLDIEIDPDDIAQLKIIGKDVNALKKKFDGKPITLEALTKYQQELNGQGVTNNVLDTAIKNWKLLESLDPSVRLQAMMTLQTLNISDSITADTASEQKAAFLKTKKGKSIKAFENSGQAYQADLFQKELTAYKNSPAGIKVAQDYITDLMNRIFPKAKVDTTKKGGPVTEEGKKGAMDVSWLSELLQKLKLFRESTIDSTGTFKELLGQVEKYFGAKLFKANPMLTALDKQRSAIEQIKKSSADAGITLSSSFINLLESLDAEAFEDLANKLFTINSEGKYALKLLPGVAEQMAKMEPEGRVVKPNQTVVGVINEAFKAGNLVDFINKQRDAIAQTKSLTGAFTKLTDGTLGFKMTADQAAKVINDFPGMAEDIAKGVMKFSQDDINGINKSLKEYYSTLAKSNTEKLLPATSVIENQTKALDALVAENIDLDVALKIIQDQAMAAYIALDPSVIKGDLAAVIQQFVTLEEVVKKLEDSTFFKQRTATLQLKKDFAAIAPLLLQMGLDLEDVNAILSNPNLAKAFIQDLKDGKLDAEQLKKYIDEIPEYKRVELELKLSTREGKEEEFDKLFSKAMEYYDLLEGKIEDDFEPLLKSAQDKIDDTQEKIEGINEEIQDFQDNIDTKQRKIELEITRPIDVLQKESSDLGNDLDLMNRSADEITKRYDEQAEALTKVSEINSRIANQQKQQLSLADALSQGDISAAALAAQEIRATSAEAMQEDQLGILGAAKERDIANLRSKGGLTRLQIENRQFAISQEIYALEQKREVELLAIRDIEDKIYDIKVGRLKLAQDELDLANKALKDYQKQRDAAIEAVDRQREVWRDAKLAIGFARIDAGYYNDVISFSNTLIDLMKDGWLGVGDAILAAVAALALYNSALKKPLTLEQARAQAQGTLTGYLDNFGTQLGNTDQQIVDLELKIAEAMEKGEDTSALEAQLAALRESADKLADNMYDVAGALDKVDNATTIAKINSSVSEATTIKQNPYGDGDIEWEPWWVPGDGEGGAGGDFVQVASKGGIIKPKYLRKGGLTNPLYRPMGGLIPYFLGGGFAKGTDTVPAMLTPGEFVMSRYAVNAHGIDRMKAINSGDSIGESVYNYSINVNVKSDANPDEIARAVMTHIKQVDSKRLRGAQI